MIKSIHKLNPSQGIKRRFIKYGIINVLITNTSLQILLLITSIPIATLASQTINLVFGYYIYSKKVFKVKEYKLNSAFYYIALAIFTWNINWISINYLWNIGINKNVAASILIPILAIISYLIQKSFIFSSKSLAKR